jgi:hypothetical protein
MFAFFSLRQPLQKVDLMSSPEDFSKASLHAALTALAVSAVALSLITPLSDLPSLQSLADYGSERASMASAIDAVALDPCYQRVLKHHPDLGTFSIDQLSRYYCGPKDEIYLGETRTWQPLLTFKHEKGVTSEGKPHAPTDLKVWGPLVSMRGVIDALSALHDPALIESARRVNGRFDHAIFRWDTLKYQLVAHRQQEKSGVVQVQSGTRADLTPEEVQQDTMAMLALLQFQDVKQLASYEPIEIQQFEDTVADRDRVSLPTLSLSRIPITTAATFVHVLLVLSLGWLWLNQRELVARPEDDSVFTMFGRSRLSQGCLAVLWLIPVVTPILLVYFSPNRTSVHATLTAINLAFALGIANQTRQLWGMRNSLVTNGPRGSEAEVADSPAPDVVETLDALG